MADQPFDSKIILEELAKFAVTQVGKKLLEQIVGKDYGAAEQTIKEIVKAQKESFANIEIKLEQVVAQNEISKKALQIRSWADDLEERLKWAREGHPEELEDLYKDINHAAVGMKPILSYINAILMGNETDPGGTKGTILIYMDKLYERLGAHADLNYTINSYLADIGKFLTYHMALQQTGLSLRMSAARAHDDPKEWQAKMEETIQKQLRLVYDNLPPLIRKMKTDVFSPMHSTHWWRLKANGEVLTESQTGNERGYGKSTDKPCSRTEWRFSPSLDSMGSTNLQSRSYPHLYVGVLWAGIGKRSLTHESTKMMNGKVVPEKTGNELKFKLVSKAPEYRTDWPFGHDWILDDDGVGQE